MIQETKNEVASLNSLLRGELSAVETYKIALRKLGHDRPVESARLREILSDHQEHAVLLRAEIARRGGEADEDSGAWGVYARAVESAATILGDTAALKALKEGEEHGLKEYEESLEDDSLDLLIREVIASRAIPTQRLHVTMLDQLMDRTAH